MKYSVQYVFCLHTVRHGCFILDLLFVLSRVCDFFLLQMHQSVQLQYMYNHKNPYCKMVLPTIKVP